MSIQERINRLLWDRRLVVLPKDMEAPHGLEYVILRDLKLEDRNYYLFIRDLEEHKARSDGVPTEGEIMQKARESGYWTADDDDVEKRADSHIAFLESEFQAKAKFKSRQNIIKLQIEDAKAKKELVATKRSHLKQKTAEYLAHEIASFMLLRRVAWKSDDKLLMPDDTSFLYFKENYLILMFYLIYEIMGEGMMEVADIREIARSVEWRLTWTLCRENLPTIFGRSIGDLNINHKTLIYWSRVYDSAFESTEPPEKDVINDDERFDLWLSNKELNARDNDKKTNKSGQEEFINLQGEYINECVCGMKTQNLKKGLGEKLPHAEHCRFGHYHEFSEMEKQERINRVYKRNSDNIRKLLDREQEAIQKHGVIEDQHLRGMKSRHVLGMSTNIIKIK